MRHKISGRKFDRPSDERRALFRMLVADLMRHERLKTTEAKAKEVRPIAEKMITLGKDGTVHARRQAQSFINDKDVVKKLFDDIAPRFAARPGGYTRIIRLGYRRGDSAEVAQIELIGSEYDPKAAPQDRKTSDTPKKTAGVGDRLRAAAERLRGKKEDAAESRKASGGASTKGRAAKKNTPQKSG